MLIVSCVEFIPRGPDSLKGQDPMVPIAVCEEVGMLPDLPAKSAYSIQGRLYRTFSVESVYLGWEKASHEKCPCQYIIMGRCV